MFIYAALRAMSKECGADSILIEAVKSLLTVFDLPRDVIFYHQPKVTLKQRIALIAHSYLVKGKGRMTVYGIERKFKWLLSLFNVYICTEGFIPVPYNRMRNNNFYCIGFFQSPRYFRGYEHVIRAELKFNQEIRNHCYELSQLMRENNSVCLHVRLGDYLELPHFKVISPDYYRRAIKLMHQKVPNAKFFIFTDTPELLNKYIDINNEEHYIIPHDYSDVESLYLGSQCKHHIMANSSFSWWMQFLAYSDSQVVIAPSKWFSTPAPCDIYQNHWTIVEV